MNEKLVVIFLERKAIEFDENLQKKYKFCLFNDSSLILKEDIEKRNIIFIEIFDFTKLNIIKDICKECYTIIYQDFMNIIDIVKLYERLIKKNDYDIKINDIESDISEVFLFINKDKIIKNVSGNYTEMFNCSKDMLIDNSFLLFVAESDKSNFQNYLYNAHNESNSVKFELIICNYDKKNKIIEITIKIKNDNSYLLILNDITSIRLKEKELIDTKKSLEQFDKLKRTFILNINHEIKTPLNGIMGMAQLIKMTELDNEQINNIDNIMDCANILLKMIENIIEISKIEANSIIAENDKFSIKESINEIDSIFKKLIETKNIKFIVEYDKDIPINLYGDNGKFKEIITNILHNSFKFTNNGEIKFQLKHKVLSDKKIELKVTIIDTGIGIDKNLIEDIFKPFVLIDSSFARKNSGLGLGLSICKSLVENNGGRIFYESEINKGSKFVFTYLVEVSD